MPGFEKAYFKLSEDDRSRLARIARRMVGKANLNITWEDLQQATFEACLRRTFREDIDTMAFVIKTMQSVASQFLRERRRELDNVELTEIDDSRISTIYVQPSPEDELVANDHYEKLVSGLSPDAQVVAVGRSLGWTGKELMNWSRLGERRFGSAWKALYRANPSRQMDSSRRKLGKRK
jgi:DNA-directed RNA polymerase specialized sigma24 family protein